MQPDELHSLRSATVHTKDKIDLHKVGKDIYELLVHPGRRSFKQRARKQTVELKPDIRYTPSEVAALLNVSYDTAVRRMQSMKGIVDMGTQTKRYKRGKKMLRISGKHLLAYLREAAPPHSSAITRYSGFVNRLNA
ncbi:MAG: hypothetical protein ABR866_12185 [Candidatus Korobacteraceae bacterium]